MNSNQIKIKLLDMTSNDYYLPHQSIQYFRDVGVLNKVKTKKGIFYNTPCSFDIETTSFYKVSTQMEKVAIMYEWTFCILGKVMIGRTWGEFIEFCNELVDFYGLNEIQHMIVYVHNLAFEFQFLRKLFEWKKVFSLESRKPIQAITSYGIEFRCSYLLSGYSLSKLAEQLTEIKIKKLVGDLDYSLIRHSHTPLYNNEIMYCINDVRIIVAYIYESILREGDITKIPLTKTGYVRKYCRNKCLYENDDKRNSKFHTYRKLMKRLTLDGKTYLQLKQAFAGGFTHASPYYANEILKNISSFDFGSSYPYVLISEQFPMSKPELITIKSNEEFYKNLSLYCCLFDIEIFNLESEIYFENYISKSHCRELEDAIENNGRIVSAKHLKMTVTEQDFDIISKFYKWEKFLISNFRRFKKNYLPKDLVLSILKLYVDKTELKGVDGKEIEYLQSKERVNACYGMMVTDICRDEIIYEDEWVTEKNDIEESIMKYNKSIKRFLYYPWGVWVTAYARRNLFTGICEFGYDYVYSDTDSIKVMNKDKHMDYINSYNNYVLRKLKIAMDYHGIDIEMTRPKNIKGETKQIGIWDFEGTYSRFKTLGAKRYMYEKDGKINLTVSGVNKSKAVPYLIKTFGDKIFEKFDDELYIPKEYTGKMTHTYIDNEQIGIVTDYLGNKYNYHEYSSVHLENADYSLSLSKKYVDFLLGIKTYTK